MSHFAVLVIGPNVDAQLAPYHEFECTGTNDQYVQDLDITEEVQEQMTGEEPMSLHDALDYHGLADKIVSDESEVKKEGEDAPHMWGYAIVKDGKLIKAVCRTNPNKKWDWYVLGGRWSGFLKLKPGAKGELGRPGLMGSCANEGQGFSDSTTKGAIDFEGMRNDAATEAAANWDKVAEATGGLLWTSWDAVRAAHKDDIGAAREAYHAQESKKQADKALGDDFFLDVDQYLTPRDQFIQQARDRATMLYAVVKDGQWLGKGEMGWFGMSSGDEDQDTWNRKVNELIDGLPDDTLISVVDCHI